MKYDAVIIGAGLSGIAAGIRLAHFGKKVAICEAHGVAGGLNSFYRRAGRSIDVGLHAMTNYAPRGAHGAPLTKLLRQLRIRHEELALCEQTYSQVRFPGRTLDFSNDPEMLAASVATVFPREADGFTRLRQRIAKFDDVALDAAKFGARGEIAKFIRDPILIDMLLCPLMYYGNPSEDDMDFAHFCVMFKSIFESGFARPENGMRHLIGLLIDKFKAAGGELRLGTRVAALAAADGRIEKAVLEDGGEIDAKIFLSCAGRVETLVLAGADESALSSEIGRLSFVEAIFALDSRPRDLGVDASIIFFNAADEFVYRGAAGPGDLSSGVICVPNNFRGEELREGMLRVTVKASHAFWKGLYLRSRGEYAAAKDRLAAELVAVIGPYAADLTKHTIFRDIFTPVTIERYTGHLGGAVYGSPVKDRFGKTYYGNLFLIGTDQGFLGIVGSLLSGISIANLYCLV